MFAGGVGWAAALWHTHHWHVPVSMGALIGGQFLHNRHRRELLAQKIATAIDSRRHLELQIRRPLFDAAIM
jgi:hypothetical protein